MKKRISEMTDQEKNQAIAVASGWTVIHFDGIDSWDNPCGDPEKLPNFLNSLDMIQEAVLSLIPDDHTAFCLHVCDICKREKAWPILANATLRSDAFLLTIGHEL